MLQARRLTGASPGPDLGGLQRNGTLHQEMPVNSPPPPTTNNGPYNPPSAPPMTNGPFGAPSGPPPPQQPNYQNQQPYPPLQPSYPQTYTQSQPPTDGNANPFDDPRNESGPSQAPTDYGLPPTVSPTKDSNTFHSSGPGYHSHYHSPPPSTANNGFARKEVGSGSNGAGGERSPMHGHDSSDDENEMRHGPGRTKGGQPVTYRF